MLESHLPPFNLGLFKFRDPLPLRLIEGNKFATVLMVPKACAASRTAPTGLLTIRFSPALPMP